MFICTMLILKLLEFYLKTIESSINSYYCNQQLSCQRHELAWNGSWTPKPIKNVMCNAGVSFLFQQKKLYFFQLFFF